MVQKLILLIASLFISFNAYAGTLYQFTPDGTQVASYSVGTPTNGALAYVDAGYFLVAISNTLDLLHLDDGTLVNLGTIYNPSIPAGGDLDIGGVVHNREGIWVVEEGERVVGMITQFFQRVHLLEWDGTIKRTWSIAVTPAINGLTMNGKDLLMLGIFAGNDFISFRAVEGSSLHQTKFESMAGNIFAGVTYDGAHVWSFDGNNVIQYSDDNPFVQVRTWAHGLSGLALADGIAYGDGYIWIFT